MHNVRYKFGAINKNDLECGPMPNVMAALPNVGGVAHSAERRKSG